MKGKKTPDQSHTEVRSFVPGGVHGTVELQRQQIRGQMYGLIIITN